MINEFKALEDAIAANAVEFTVVLRRLGGSIWEGEVRELDGSEFAKVWGYGPHGALEAAVPYMACHGDGLPLPEPHPAGGRSGGPRAQDTRRGPP